jgi:uncharacterized coiled-coil DUF342 family protein
MSELDKALDRLGSAVAQLIEGAGRKQNGAEVADQLAELTAERDRLKAEVKNLLAQRKEDSKLRSEAAEAVRDALSDLRGLVAQSESAKGAGND